MCNSFRVNGMLSISSLTSSTSFHSDSFLLSTQTNFRSDLTLPPISSFLFLSIHDSHTHRQKPIFSCGPLMLKTYISFAASGNYSVSVFNGHHFLRLSFSYTFSSMSGLSVCNYPQVKDRRCPSEPSCLRAYVSKKSPVWISSSFQSQTFSNAVTSLVCLEKKCWFLKERLLWRKDVS